MTEGTELAIIFIFILFAICLVVCLWLMWQYSTDLDKCHKTIKIKKKEDNETIKQKDNQISQLKQAYSDCLEREKRPPTPEALLEAIENMGKKANK